MKVTATKESKQLKMGGECLSEEIIALKTAIEEAIMKGQKSLVILSNIPEPSLVSDEDSALACVGAGPGIVGWVDDF